LVVLTVGCAGSPPPEQHLYMMRTGSGLPTYESELSVGIESVTIAPYLKRAEVMLQVAPQELRPARYHRWAEPLNENIRRYLRDRLSADLQTNVDASVRFRERWQLQIDVVVEELHGLLEGGAVLNAYYDVVPKGNPENTRRGHVSARVEQSAPGYPALVDAQSELLDQLAGRIADDVKAIQPSPP
jgi:uncharacterized lipoprotein YmbA